MFWTGAGPFGFQGFVAVGTGFGGSIAEDVSSGGAALTAALGTAETKVADTVAVALAEGALDDVTVMSRDGVLERCAPRYVPVNAASASTATLATIVTVRWFDGAADGGGGACRACGEEVGGTEGMRGGGVDPTAGAGCGGG